jgi:hypothetical protein
LGHSAAVRDSCDERVQGGILVASGKTYAYIDGTCELPLPEGPVTVEVSKGFEFLPIRREIAPGLGQIALRLSVQRWIDMRAEGWLAGDAAAYFLMPHAALLEAQAEDVPVANVLITEKEAGSADHVRSGMPSNMTAFSGQKPALERSGYVVVVNSHNYHPQLGSLHLLNCHRLVFPLRMRDANGPDTLALADWCDQCHRKGGLVIWRPSSGSSGEALADLILGKINAVDLSEFGRSADLDPLYYALLGCGLQVPLAGASNKSSCHTALGSVRTYAKIKGGEDGNSYGAWIAAVRAGRTFVTTGPLVLLEVDGHDPGEVIDLPSVAARLTIRAQAASVDPFDVLEVVANGQVVATTQRTAATPPASIDTRVELPRGGWIVARCKGPEGILRAHTSPVYIRSSKEPPPFDSKDYQMVAEELRKSRCIIAQISGIISDHQRARIDTIVGDALQLLSDGHGVSAHRLLRKS